MSSPSLVALFDDYARKTRVLIESDSTKEFLAFVRSATNTRVQLRDECQRLKLALDKATSELAQYERKLASSRSAHHKERTRADEAEAERDMLHDELGQIRDTLGVILREGGKMANDTKQKIDRFINTTQARLHYSNADAFQNSRLESINEVNSTGDLLGDVLSDLSNSSSIELADRTSRRVRKQRRSEAHVDDVPTKRTRRSPRLSSSGVPHTQEIQKTTRDHLVATTTVSVPPSGPVVASSKIETVPGSRSARAEPPAIFIAPSAPPMPTVSSSEATSSSSDTENAPPGTPFVPSNSLTRKHEFAAKTMLRSDECCVCLKTMSFGLRGSKCTGCKVEVHSGCRDGVPAPCIPLGATPRVGRSARLADFCGTAAPFVPPLVVRCVIEVERRGIGEHGIYRVPGSEKDVRSLKALLLKLKGTVNLSGYEIPVICGVLKDFLRSLPEPLITHALWQSFANAVVGGPDDRTAALYQLVSELPVTHRDTLAYIMVHLINVAENPHNMMDRHNLAVVFGPTLVSFSSANPSTAETYAETIVQPKVIEGLFDLGEDYWSHILKSRPSVPTATPQRTPKYNTRRNATMKSLRLFNSPAK